MPKPNPDSDINGCGSYNLNINFDKFNAGEFNDCCNVHDGCYEVCNESRKLCDDRFHFCLSNHCDTWATENNWGLAKKLCNFGGE